MTQVRNERGDAGNYPKEAPENWAEAWTERKVIHTFDDGWTLELTHEPADRWLDGKFTAGVYTCIYPGYGMNTPDPWGKYLATGKYMILSLRDADGKPHGHMTFGEGKAVMKFNVSLDRSDRYVGAYFSAFPHDKKFERLPRIIDGGVWWCLECVMPYRSDDRAELTARCRDWYNSLEVPKWAEGHDFKFMRETCTKVLRAMKEQAA